MAPVAFVCWSLLIGHPPLVTSHPTFLPTRFHPTPSAHPSHPPIQSTRFLQNTPENSYPYFNGYTCGPNTNQACADCACAAITASTVYFNPEVSVRMRQFVYVYVCRSVCQSTSFARDYVSVAYC